MTNQLSGLIIKNYQLTTRHKGSLICQVYYIIMLTHHLYKYRIYKYEPHT